MDIMPTSGPSCGGASASPLIQPECTFFALKLGPDPPREVPNVTQAITKEIEAVLKDEFTNLPLTRIFRLLGSC